MLIAFLLFTFNAMKSSLLCVGHTGKSATSCFFYACACSDSFMMSNFPVLHIVKLHAVPTLINFYI